MALDLAVGAGPINALGIRAPRRTLGICEVQIRFGYDLPDLKSSYDPSEFKISILLN
jgi:hypothetical protein